MLYFSKFQWKRCDVYETKHNLQLIEVKGIKSSETGQYNWKETIGPTSTV